MRHSWTTACVVVATFVTGCGEKGEHVDAEGCEHLEEGPAVALTATATADGAPALASDHRRYDVMLPEIAAGPGADRAGFAKYAAAEESDYLFYFGVDVPVQFLDAAGAVMAPEESATSSTACTAIKGRHLIPLPVGTFALRLGPSTHPSVSIVVEPAKHAAH